MAGGTGLCLLSSNQAPNVRIASGSSGCYIFEKELVVGGTYLQR